MASRTILTPEGRCAFMHVFEPSTDPFGGVSYSVRLMFPKTMNMAWIEDAWKAVCIEEFKTATPPGLRPLYSKDPEQDKGFIQDGDLRYQTAPIEKKPLYEAYRENWIVPLKTSPEAPPAVVGPDKVEIVDRSAFASGDYARAVIEVSAYTMKRLSKPMVSVRLRAIQKTRDGERFSGGVSASQAVEMLDEVAVGPTNIEDVF